MNKIFIVNYLGRDCYERKAVPVKAFKHKKQAEQWRMQHDRFWEYEVVKMKVEK